MKTISLAASFAVLFHLASNSFAESPPIDQKSSNPATARAALEKEADKYPFSKSEAEDCYRYRKQVAKASGNTSNDSNYGYACFQPDGRWIFRN